MGQDYYHKPPSKPTGRGRLRQNSPRLSNLRHRLDSRDSLHKFELRTPGMMKDGMRIEILV